MKKGKQHKGDEIEVDWDALKAFNKIFAEDQNIDIEKLLDAPSHL